MLCDSCGEWGPELLILVGVPLLWMWDVPGLRGALVAIITALIVSWMMRKSLQDL